MIHFFGKKSFFFTLTIIYLCILTVVSSLACLVSFTQRKDAFLTSADSVYSQLENSFSETLDSFWQIYLEVVDNDSSVYTTLMEYFSSSPDLSLSIRQINALDDALRRIMLQDNQVQWIALYSPYRSSNYILFNTSSSPVVYNSDSFPYMESLLSREGKMEILPQASLSTENSSVTTFALCGNTPKGMNGGKIIAGYSIAPLEQIFQNSELSSSGLTYTLSIVEENMDTSGIIFQSSAKDISNPSTIYNKTMRGNTTSATGQTYYVRSNACGSSKTFLSYEIPHLKLFLYAHKNTPVIMLLVLAFAFLSIFIYALMLHFIAKEVTVIHDNLMEIGHNHLDHRIPTNFRQSGFSEIARSINEMAENLDKNIARAYYYELKQKESELAELQAKFNPHFLYNSLEMLRSKCYQNGDIQTADLITSLSGIFRGFIGSKTFIPLAEELAFSRKYLALFNARYQDQVEIRFDIDNECLQYGIIRNLFQPLIENYFVHGFETNNPEGNYIYFQGKSLDEKTLLFTVEDNGVGMSDEDLSNINNRLNEPIEISTESYGLKNLQQRLRLFYGSDCGLIITHGKSKGVSIQIKVHKLTCAEYEAQKSSRLVR